MGTLPNTRHEIMAQHVARGVGIKLAARKAGFMSDQTAYRISREPEFQARVDEILEAAADETVMEARDVLRRLSGLAQADIRECLTVDSVANPATGEVSEQISILSPDEWTNEIAGRVAGLEFDREGRPKLKLESNLKALELLGRAHGMFKDNVAVTGKDGGPVAVMTAEMSAEECAEMFKMIIEQP